MMAEEKTAAFASGGLRAVRQRRWSACVALVVLIGAGLAVHMFVPDTAGSDVAADVLYAVAMYAAVVFVAPRLRPAAAGIIAAGQCLAVELFQLTGIPLRAEEIFPPVALALGTVFDLRDLIVYPVAIGAACAMDLMVRASIDRHG